MKSRAPKLMLAFLALLPGFWPTSSSVSVKGDPVILEIPRRPVRDIEFELSRYQRERDAKFLAALPVEGTVSGGAKVDTGPSEGTTGAQEPQQIAYEEGSIEALICSVFTEDCARAVRVARCESNLNPSARNRSGAAGLFQLLGHADLFEAHGWDAATDWSDPYKNTVVAHDLWSSSGWAPWVCK